MFAIQYPNSDIQVIFVYLIRARNKVKMCALFLFLIHEANFVVDGVCAWIINVIYYFYLKILYEAQSFVLINSV